MEDLYGDDKPYPIPYDAGYFDFIINKLSCILSGRIPSNLVHDRYVECYLYILFYQD